MNAATPLRAPMLCVLALCAAGCAGRAPASAPAAAPPPPPPSRQLPEAPAVVQSMPVQSPALAALYSGAANKPVTFSAKNADLRRMISLLADAAGVSVYIAPEVAGQVSVDFKNVPARDALLSLLAGAHLIDVPSLTRSPWPPVVFYRLAVDVDCLDAAAIQERYEVGPEVAQTLVASRLAGSCR